MTIFDPVIPLEAGSDTKANIIETNSIHVVLNALVSGFFLLTAYLACHRLAAISKEYNHDFYRLC